MKPTRIASLLAVAVLLMTTAFAQNPATYGTNAGRYGLTGWAVNGQRVASQFNYYIDSTYQTAVGGVFNFTIGACTQALPLGGNKNVNPFNTNASVKIQDVNSSNTETVNGVAPVYSGSICSLAFTTSNTHTAGSFVLRSGTCGLQEAINDMGANGGEVIVDNKFYDDGCTQSTITGLNPLVTSTSGPIRSNVYVHDISYGQDTWYGLKPSATTLITASGAALTLTGSAGGSLTNSGTYYVNYEYVDPLGGQGLANTESAQITLSSQNTITTSAIPASTGAVGAIPMITASAGASASEIAIPVTASVCTLSTLTPYPTCAIGSTVTITANPSSTSKENVESFGHTTFAFQPLNTPPVPTSGNSLPGIFQTMYLPFAQAATVTTGGLDVAQVYIPAGYLNYLGKSVDVCFKMAGTDGASGGTNLLLTAANNYAQSPVTLSTLVGAVSSSAAYEDTGCFTIVTAATGSSGTFWASGSMVQASTALTATADTTTAVSSSVDLTKGIYLTLTAKATVASATSVTVDLLSIRPTPGS